MLPNESPEKKSKPTHKSKGPSKQAKARAGESQPDLREQMFNEGLIGPIKEVQVSAARITQVRGLMFDLDPGLLQSDGSLGKIPDSPAEFYGKVIKPMLARNPVLDKAEVRNSGSGLHVILRFHEPYQCDTDAAREDISRVAEVVMCLLPIDPLQPGITALTRPIGSVNGKNGAIVKPLAPGEPITYAEVRTLAVQFVASPLSMICEVLFGSDRISPCPVCRHPGSTLVVVPHCGTCYACGKVTITHLWSELYQPRKGGLDG